jgi:hypothetical protein
MQHIRSSLKIGFLRSIVEDEEVCILFLQELWPRIVGEDLGRQTEPYTLRRKRLVLKVPNQVWERQLSDFREMIMHAVNQFWGVSVVEAVRLESPSRGGS